MEEAVGRFAVFSEEERASVMMGLTLVAVDMMYGLVGEPQPPEVVRDRMPGIVRLVNEIGTSFGLEGIDKDLMAMLNAMLDQQIAEARDARK